MIAAESYTSDDGVAWTLLLQRSRGVIAAESGRHRRHAAIPAALQRSRGVIAAESKGQTGRAPGKPGASTEPRRDRRGEVCAGALQASRNFRFNGAAA